MPPPICPRSVLGGGGFLRKKMTKKGGLKKWGIYPPLEGKNVKKTWFLSVSERGECAAGEKNRLRRKNIKKKDFGPAADENFGLWVYKNPGFIRTLPICSQNFLRRVLKWNTPDMTFFFLKCPPFYDHTKYNVITFCKNFKKHYGFVFL